MTRAALLLWVWLAVAVRPVDAQGADRAFARWVLAAAPPDAVLLADGPVDAPVLQEVQGEGLRPDVVVVEVPTLSDPEAVRALASRHGLPLPDSVETFVPRLGARGSTDTPAGRVYTLADHVLDHWLEPGALGRPLVAAVTLNPVVLGVKTDLVDRGATLAPASASGFDPEAAWATFADIRGEDFASPEAAPGTFDAGGVVLFQMLQTAVSFAQEGDPEAAERAYVHAVAFAHASGRDGDPLVEIARTWIDDALAP